MMKLPLYHIDAFTSEVFHGNPAAVMPLENWLPDEVMQRIAAENNLSETAFIVPEGGDWHIRWFTPGMEVDLCGHATLASAYVIFHHLGHKKSDITFHSKSGPLNVKRHGDTFQMDFPTIISKKVTAPKVLLDAIQIKPEAVLAGKDYMVVLPDEAAIANLKVDLTLLAQHDRRGTIFTAPAEKYDFVSRFFIPHVGITEDPVTGSAHCALAPYWAERLDKRHFKAYQLSSRGGEVICELKNDRVLLSGQAELYMTGEIQL